MERIYNILVEILGDSKQGAFYEHTTQYQFNCPCCAEENGGVPDNKYNLEVSLSTNGFFYHCWKCGDLNHTKGIISTLIKKYGNSELYKQYKEEINTLIESKMYDLNAFKTFDNKSEDDEVIITLPKTFTKIDLSKCKNTRLLEYLNKRKITQDIIDKFNIGYTTWDEEDYSLRNRIIIPSYDKFGELNYWVGRDFTGKSKMKYKNCTADKKKIIFQESLIDFDSNIILVEGAIDMIYGNNIISMLGKSLSKDSYLYQTIHQKANANIIICLDSDTELSETKEIYKLFNCGRTENKVKYIRMNKFKDFGEIYEAYQKRGIICALRHATTFKEIELI